MSTLAEIERAIENLSQHDVDALAVWLENRRQRGTTESVVDQWLQRARGAAASGVTTDAVLAETRGEK